MGDKHANKATALRKQGQDQKSKKQSNLHARKPGPEIMTEQQLVSAKGDKRVGK